MTRFSEPPNTSWGSAFWGSKLTIHRGSQSQRVKFHSSNFIRRKIVRQELENLVQHPRKAHDVLEDRSTRSGLLHMTNALEERLRIFVFEKLAVTAETAVRFAGKPCAVKPHLLSERTSFDIEHVFRGLLWLLIHPVETSRISAPALKIVDQALQQSPNSCLNAPSMGYLYTTAITHVCPVWPGMARMFRGK